MVNLKTHQTVKSMVEGIDEREYQLPSIQRPFVWEPEQIIRLLDSIMCEYPIGAVMVWLPPSKIRCRPFLMNYQPGDRLRSQLPAPGEQRARMVLDGQQRLQSLYLAFYGTYDSKRIYLRIDQRANPTEDDVHYRFELLADAEAAENPAFVFVGELAKLDIEDIDNFVRTRLPDLDDGTKKTAVQIASRFVSRFVVKDSILVQEVSEKLDYNDVLEVFERVNSGGTPLSKSDLLFSTVTLKVPNMEERFTQIVEDLNEGGRFDFDTDFVIKTTFVLFGKKAKYDYNKLSDDTYLQKLAADFENLEKVVTAVRVWLEDKAVIKGNRFLRSKSALIPIIDYLYQNERWLGPKEGVESTTLRQFLYMSYFTRLFSRAPDSPLDQIHDAILKAKAASLGNFPVADVGKVIIGREKKGSYEFRDEYLWDLDLVLNIIDGGVKEIPKKRSWSLERDHIVPRHQLSENGITADVDDVGNLRLLAKSRNISKKDKMPDENTEFFGKDDANVRSKYDAARKSLTQESFTAFVKARRELIKKKVMDFLGF
jgi:hypothetical protein